MGRRLAGIARIEALQHHHDRAVGLACGTVDGTIVVLRLPFAVAFGLGVVDAPRVRIADMK